MPDNAIYYQLAYAATAIVYVGYGLTLWRRTRRLDERERHEVTTRGDERR